MKIGYEHYKKAEIITDYSVDTGLADQPRDFKTIAKDIPCQEACPVATHVPHYIEAIANNEFEKAYRINLECNVFPGILGRICTRPCEDECRHNWTNTQGSVAICHLKRSAADETASLLKGKKIDLPVLFESTGKKIAVIGAGPAGMAAARELKRYGHDVTVFEKEQQAGGMMLHGIPRFRLPMNIIKQEIQQIVDMGVKLELNKTINNSTMKNIVNDYDAVLVATGTTKPNTLPRLNELLAASESKSESNVMIGLDFMKKYNNGEIKSLDGNLVVIGGGFTAIDCARACARASKRIVNQDSSVRMLYRRTEGSMAATLDELEELDMENVELRTLTSPVDFKITAGRVTSIIFRKNEIQEFVKDGKPKIKEVQGSDFEIPCDLLIIAIGQKQDYNLLQDICTVKEEGKTSLDKVFTVGDFNQGSLDVIHAIADAKKVVKNIDRFLMKKVRLTEKVKIELIDNQGQTGRLRDHDIQIPETMPLLSLTKRVKDNAEVETGFTLEKCNSNALRCYYCHYKFEIINDKCIHCDWCIQASPRDCIKKITRFFKNPDGTIDNYIESNISKQGTYIWIDSNECIRCGKCLRVCPTDAITMKRTEKVSTPNK